MAGFPIITGQLHMQPLVGLIMGSKSDWPTMEHAAEMLEKLGVAYETRVVSAHRTPDLLFDYAKTASDRGLRSEEHTSELQSRPHLVCRLLLEKKKKTTTHHRSQP